MRPETIQVRRFAADMPTSWDDRNTELMAIDSPRRPSPPTTPHSWLHGGGEMGELIRSLDWSATAIGPIESWSPALRMMVQFLLANRFPMLLWWGPQYISIYNDPYRPILGNKHPWALGQPVSVCWNEIWHILQPLIDTPFNGGPATWNEDIALEINRHGFIEEAHFTIAYSPVPDDTAATGIGGVLATVHEITEKVVGQRRIIALRDLGARVSDAKTEEEACTIAARTLSGHDKDIPFVLMYLIDGDRHRARLAGASGLNEGSDIGQAVIDLEGAASRGWPIAEAVRADAMQIVPQLTTRFASPPQGPWSDPPDTAVVLPIPSIRANEPIGAIVAGISARLRFDEYYKDFLELVRNQIATAIGHARAYAEERKRTIGAIPYVEEALRWLPSPAAPSHPFANALTDEDSTTPRPTGTQARVLIADDNADMREYVGRLLGQSYAVETVGDGAAALDRIRARAFDLVVADVMMPKLDGFGLLAAIRADERTRSLPVVLLSARAGEDARIEGLHAGADEYLVKPFSARELLASVAAQLRHSRERREAERTVRYRSEQYLTIMNQAPLGMYLVDEDFRIREVNPMAMPVFADIPGGVIGRDFDQIIHMIRDRNHADELVDIFRRTLATGEPYVTTEPTELRTDGIVSGYYDWRLDRITLPDARFGLVCYFRDTSEQKKVAAAKAHLAAIIDSADDAIIAKDLDGVIQSCNPAAERLFGYPASELVGRPVRILIPPERQSEEDDILARLRRGERIEHFETVRMTKAGRRLEIALTVSPVRDETGRVIGASKIARDITALKQAEAERIRLLQENAAVTEALNNVGTIVASDLDRTSVVQAVTDVATELTTAEFGAFFYNVVDEAGESYTLYTISGVPREAFSKFPMPRNTEVFEPTFKGTAIVRSDDITKDPRYGHNAPYHGMPPGHLPVRSYLAVPVRSRSGEVIGGLFFGHSQVGRFSDHHERLAVGIAAWASVALENARMYMSVQEASRLKDEFLASLSHELRTPLNAILGYARMLRTGMIAPDKKDKAIDTIERNATSLTQIVEDVLDISRIVSGKIRLNVQSVEFPDIVRAAIDAVAPAAEAKGVRLETVLDSHATPISGDPERLQQVLWNLLSNAVKFTNRGGRVQVRLERVDSHVEVIVSDTGIGISPEFLPHVFERFRQADAGISRERGGLGLGLSIARQLIEMHGGTIEASSDGVGHGATFRLKIPLMIMHSARDAVARVHSRSDPPTRNVAVADLAGVHVLAVDDERDALSLVKEVLEAVGARVSTATSAQAALSKLDHELPDVVVADLGMPTLDGFAFIERVRRHPNPRVREVPAAALTAYARSEDRVKALRAGFQIHLAKPIDPAELVTTIAALAKRFVAKAPEGSSEGSLG